MVLALCREGFPHGMIGVPTQSGDEVVMVWSAGHSVDALCFGFLKQGPLQLPPRLMKVQLIAQHERGFWSGPSHECACLPAPLLEIRDGCSHGASDGVPRVGLGLELSKGGLPGLFQGCHLLCGPGMDEAVDGFDVVQDDLVSWVDVLFVVEVIGAVKKPVAQVLGHGLPECSSVAGCQALAFHSKCCWLDTASVEA